MLSEMTEKTSVDVEQVVSSPTAVRHSNADIDCTAVEAEDEVEEGREEFEDNDEKDEERIIKRYLEKIAKSYWFHGETSEEHRLKMRRIMIELYLLIENGKGFLEEVEIYIDELAELRLREIESNEEAESENYSDELAKLRFQGAESNEGSDTYKEKIKNNYQTFLKTKERQNTTEKPLKEISTLKKYGEFEFLELRGRILNVQQQLVVRLRENQLKPQSRLLFGPWNYSTERHKYREKLKHDYQTFLEARERAIQKIEKTKTTDEPLAAIYPLKDEFWGTRQQLRSGKVVGDMLGGIDPVFGALLNPTGGRIGSEDLNWFHKVFYKEEQSLAYHAAAHDAFGYLFLYHDVGPGYNYLNTEWTSFPKESTLACQKAGIRFWKEKSRKK